MEIAHILEELAYDMGELPREAMEAAVALRSQIAPYLIYILKDAIQRKEEIIEDDNYQGHLYALYLLAQFREEEAFPLLLEMLSFPGDVLYAMLGDVLTEDLGRILASLCGAKSDLLKKYIENPSVNEYVRAACLDAFVILVGASYKNRDEVVHYFVTLFQEKLERESSFVWDQLALSTALLHPREAYAEMLRAYREGLINASFIKEEEVTLFLEMPKDALLNQLFHNTELIDDAVSEMEKWHCTHSGHS